MPGRTHRPDYLDLNCLKVIRKGTPRWTSQDGQRLFEWDHTHGHIEVYNSRGRHIGVIEPETGNEISGAVRGRSIDVK